MTLVPFFHNANVFTAYEYLERRFDAKTRAFTAFCSCCRGACRCGVVHLGAGRRAVGDARASTSRTRAADRRCRRSIYTMFGGVQAVAWTDVKQMVLIVGGLVAAVVVLILEPAA